jgi:bifunctional DNA-binding transcriptional regulator/antitoxin component of YhaV-PrlF toxin-antitoxin module
VFAHVDGHGRIVLPDELIEKYGIRELKRIRVTDIGDAIMLVPISSQHDEEVESELERYLPKSMGGHRENDVTGGSPATDA